MRIKMSFSWRKIMDVDHGYYLLLLGRALQKAHNENRDLPRNFILSTCFVYLLFLFSLFSFSPFLFSLFFQPLGGRSPHRPPQIRHWIYLAISFFLLIYCCWGGALQKAHNENRDLPRNFILSTGFVSLLFLFSLFSFSPFLFSLFFIFFVSLWGRGDLPHRPPPSDSPLDLHRNFILSTCFVYLLFIFSLFSSSPFLFSLFFIYFCQPLGGRSPPSPPSGSPLDLPRNFILSTCFVYLLFLFSLFSFSPFLFSLFFIYFCQPLGGDLPHRPPQIRHWIYLAISFFLLVLFIYFSFFLSFLFLLSSFPSFLFFLSAFGGGGRSPPSPPLQIRHWLEVIITTTNSLVNKFKNFNKTKTGWNKWLKKRQNCNCCWLTQGGRHQSP